MAKLSKMAMMILANKSPLNKCGEGLADRLDSSPQQKLKLPARISKFVFIRKNAKLLKYSSFVQKMFLIHPETKLAVVTNILNIANLRNLFRIYFFKTIDNVVKLRKC